MHLPFLFMKDFTELESQGSFYFKPVLAERYNVSCFFFTRLGGLSKGPFSSFNFSFQVGDDPEDVRKNFTRLKKITKAYKIITLDQIHSDNVFIYDGRGKREWGDAIITAQRRVFIGVKTADCLPVILLDKKNNVIAAVHAGWRGTVKNILGKTISILYQKFNTRSEDILVFTGPHICENCYEVSEEIAVRFPSGCFSKKDGKFYASLLKANIFFAKDSGVLASNIYSLNLCTKENEIFFSYRRDKETGRMISGIMFN